MRSARTNDERGLDRYDRLLLERALTWAADLRFFRRLQAVLLLARGWPVPEIAHHRGQAQRRVPLAATVPGQP